MTLPAFAEVDDLAVRTPGGIEDADKPRAQAALDDASSKVRAEAGKSWVAIDDDDVETLDLPTGADAWRADTIVRVTLASAKRVFDNPGGITQQSLGEYSETVANSSSDAYLTAQERRDVRRAAGRSSIGAVPTTRGPIETSRGCRYGAGETEYLPVTPAGKDIPFSGPEGY